MLGNLSGWHLLVIVFVILLLFGAPKLPGLARSLGQSMKIFKKEVTENGGTESTADEATVESVAEEPAKKPAAKKPAAKKSATK